MRLYLVLIIVVCVGCGKAPVGGVAPTTLTSCSGVLPDTQCQVTDLCTHSDAAGYKCDSAKRNSVDGCTCTITKTDFHTDPTCESMFPGRICKTDAWGGPTVPYQCCPLIKGAGSTGN